MNFFWCILKFLTILRFYDPFLRSEFMNGFPCRVKIAILTTLFTHTNIQIGIICYWWSNWLCCCEFLSNVSEWSTLILPSSSNLSKFLWEIVLIRLVFTYEETINVFYRCAVNFNYFRKYATIMAFFFQSPYFIYKWKTRIN
jgi:hypothetical protein